MGRLGPDIALFSLIRASLVCLFLVTLSPSRTDASIALSINDAKIENGAKVEFRQVSSSIENIDSVRLSQMKVTETLEHKFSVCADLDATRGVNEYGFVNYVFYVRSKSGSDKAPFTRFDFQGTPSGSFLDRKTDIEFTVTDSNGTTDVGSILLPVHSFFGENAISVSPGDDSDVPVHLSGDTLLLRVENKLQDLSVTILNAEIRPGDNTVWKNAPALRGELSADHPVVLDPRSKRTLEWRFDPNPWKALARSLVPLSKADETLTCTIVCASALGGFRRPVEIAYTVHFYPTPIWLATMPALGALAASVLVFFGVKKNRGLKRLLAAAGINILLALIIEVAGILLWTYSDSKFVLVGIDLNPLLLLPAMFVGIVSGIYGFKIVGMILGEAKD